VAQLGQEDRLMMTRRTHGIGLTLQEARQRFERWRKARSDNARSPIPERLWALAVEVAQEHGVNPTCRALRLNYTTLKEHVQAAADHQRSRPRSPAFVELTPAVLPSCTIELENAQGSKMKIHLAHPESLDLVALSRNLWGARR
jgi:hypothetical protein